MPKEKNITFLTAYPDTILCCQSQSHKHGPEAFFTAFGKTWNNCGSYEPLLLASNHSGGGELAQTYGLFKKNNQFYDVYGTECSIWDFNGQWEPEKTTIEEVLHKITKGDLGAGDSYGQEGFVNELKAFLVSMMEQSKSIDYFSITHEDKFNLYAKEFLPENLTNNNIIYHDIMKEFSFNKNYRHILKLDVIETFQILFKEHLLSNYDLSNIYAFSSNESSIFIQICPCGDDILFIANKNIHDKNFDLFSVSPDINNIIENMALSLLEKRNLFKDNMTDLLSIAAPHNEKIKLTNSTIRM